ncbi:MAG: nitrate reductase cytochrome c-type subunit [Thalassovita sp.]
MKKPSLISALALSALFATSGFAPAQDSNPAKPLRDNPIDAPAILDDVLHQDQKRFPRNYRQQPPLIPHTIQQYQIDRNANECLACHDWTNAGDRGAPTLSMTHYLDRDGNQLDTIAGTRWFCNQCHVPQADTPALVGNNFTPSN